MTTVLVITFLALFISVLIVRTSPEQATAVGAGIGIIVFAVNYPVGFGITMAVFFLIIAVWLLCRARHRAEDLNKQPSDGR